MVCILLLFSPGGFYWMVKPNGLVRGFHQMFYLFGTVLDAYVVSTKLTAPVAHVGLSFLLVESIF